MAENEVAFRQYNERVSAGYGELEKIASEDGQRAYGARADGGQPLHFYCECSDENCQRRLQLTLDRYTAIHANRRRFVIIPGHETKAIERVVSEHDGYVVVEKTVKLPARVAGLQVSEADNS